jgi:hypothetical protein
MYLARARPRSRFAPADDLRRLAAAGRSTRLNRFLVQPTPTRRVLQSARCEGLSRDAVCRVGPKPPRTTGIQLGRAPARQRSDNASIAGEARALLLQNDRFLFHWHYQPYGRQGRREPENAEHRQHVVFLHRRTGVSVASAFGWPARRGPVTLRRGGTAW